MGKIIFLCTIFYVSVYGGKTSSEEIELQSKCLQCHKKDQIPNVLIYRRYLMKYSTQEAIEKAILKYLKDPKKENSIMPPPFFLKFPMKKALDFDDETLKKNISTFLNTFDVKKKLVLP